MINQPAPGMLVGVVSDSTGHGITLASFVTLKSRHPDHSDAWWVEEHKDVWVRTCDVIVLV